MALRDIGEKAISVYENGVGYQDDPDPDRKIWTVGEHRPRGTTMMGFARAAHRDYSTLDFNKDEREFAAALDATKRGMWVRNPSTANLGYSIPLPAKVDESSRFYPDFLWWPDPTATCWALDTTGRHLLNAKVRGKLIALDEPSVALVVRGEIDLTAGTITGQKGGVSFGHDSTWRRSLSGSRTWPRCSEV